MYDHTSSQESVNQACKELFTQKGRAIDGLPPTLAALVKQMNRAAYQTGHCWRQMMVVTPELSSPSDWGWKWKDASSSWEVQWTTLPEATQACCQVLKCGCKKGSTKGKCECAKASLPCTALCYCSGACSQN